ncbi:MAG: hypothetical protein CVT95_12905 [Bacteroidetes bacterium HGW-Bacteroidetes-12]|nr:MAG: hypothetical protein CVT95_12905 [Bacteroidetes bacterium HGW-Bacteroidetes-12]
MKQKTTNILLLFFVAILSACTSKEITVSEYLYWVKNPENGLVVSKEFENYKISLFYKPIEYIAINEQRTTSLDTLIFFNRLKELNGFQYYTLKIESLSGEDVLSTNISTEQQYFDRLYYFTDAIEYNLMLEENSDTLSCQLCHFERNYGVAPYNNIDLGFINTGIESDKTLVFNDQVLGLGKVKFKIAKKDIDNIPNIKLN